jgi:ABC-2 type transport system ATP-binding protein
VHEVEVSRVAKQFGATQAVTDVSFTVARGEIFGLLGPNGAGKTTTIRMILDIFKPDGGSVSILGGAMTDAKKDRIGYMPEERGLYQDVALERCLIYLATLKGVPPAEARRRLGPLLDRFDLAAHRGKKIKELSKGMQQKAQIISTLLHRPQLMIVDEPFAGLDPINTQLVKDLLQEQSQEGAAILMSTHQMHQVEAMCDRIVLINEGRNVLYGRLDEIRRQYAGGALLVQVGDTGELPSLVGVEQVMPHNDAAKLILAPGVTSQQILEQLVSARVPLDRFEIAMPTLDEIFIRMVSAGRTAEEADHA